MTDWSSNAGKICDECGKVIEPQEDYVHHKGSPVHTDCHPNSSSITHY